MESSICFLHLSNFCFFIVHICLTSTHVFSEHGEFWIVKACQNWHSSLDFLSYTWWISYSTKGEGSGSRSYNLMYSVSAVMRESMESSKLAILVEVWKDKEKVQEQVRKKKKKILDAKKDKTGVTLRIQYKCWFSQWLVLKLWKPSNLSNLMNADWIHSLTNADTNDSSAIPRLVLVTESLYRM